MRFLIPLFIYLLGNFYVFNRIWIGLPPSMISRVCLIIFATITVSSLFITFIAGDAMPIGLTSFTYKIGSSWPIILLYLIIIFLFQDILGLANKLLHFMPSDALSRYTKDNWIGLGFIAGFVVMLMLCGYLKYQWKAKVPITINIEKTISDSLPSTPLRIVGISDLHLGYNIDKKELEKWVEKINSENPDIVIIAGDIIDNSTRPLIKDNFAEALRKLKAPMGVYACMGNHEFISGVKESVNFINSSGIQLLRDSVAEVNNRLYIVGRDDRSNKNRQPLSNLTANLDKSKPIILLDHQPYHLEEAESNGIDLQFSGHTHQGQVWPISLVTKKIYEIDYGYKTKGNTHIIVSSGIGIWGGKFRIGTQSEYIVIDINQSNITPQTR